MIRDTYMPFIFIVPLMGQNRAVTINESPEHLITE
jgi:hypothetical protein